MDPKVRSAIAANLIFYADLLWHYAQVLPEDERLILGSLFSDLFTCEGGDRAEIAAAIDELMDRHEVELVIRSKHREIVCRFAKIGVD